MSDYPELRLELNPYAVDILPITANKKQAAKKSMKKLDPTNSIERWYAIGDSEADMEMANANRKKVQFHRVPRGDTSTTHIILDNILRGKY